MRNLVLLLNSADLNTRIYALKLINNLLCSSPSELVLNDLLDSLNKLNINLFLQVPFLPLSLFSFVVTFFFPQSKKSLWIQHLEMNKQLKLFEKTSGISLFNLEVDFTRTSVPSSTSNDPFLLLEEIRRLKDEIQLLKLGHSASGENKCFDATHLTLISQQKQAINDLLDKNRALESKLNSLATKARSSTTTVPNTSVVIVTPSTPSSDPSLDSRFSRSSSYSPSTQPYNPSP